MSPTPFSLHPSMVWPCQGMKSRQNNGLTFNCLSWGAGIRFVCQLDWNGMTSGGVVVYVLVAVVDGIARIESCCWWQECNNKEQQKNRSSRTLSTVAVKWIAMRWGRETLLLLLGHTLRPSPCNVCSGKIRNPRHHRFHCEPPPSHPSCTERRKLCWTWWISAHSRWCLIDGPSLLFPRLFCNNNIISVMMAEFNHYSSWPPSTLLISSTQWLPGSLIWSGGRLAQQLAILRRAIFPNVVFIAKIFSLYFFLVFCLRLNL